MRTSLIEHPPPMKGDRSKRDLKKCCNFHNSIGHVMKDYINLKNAIESLVRKGTIRQFVRKRKSSREQVRSPNRHQETTPNKQSIVGVINMIVSTAKEWATSKSKHKSDLCSVMAVDMAPKRLKHPTWEVSFNEGNSHLLSNRENDPMSFSPPEATIKSTRSLLIMVA